MTRRTRPELCEAVYAAVVAQPDLTTEELQLALSYRISPQQLARYTSTLALRGRITASRAVGEDQQVTLKYRAVQA